MRKVSRRWVEPLLVGLVAVVLVAAFLAAWPRLSEPSHQDVRDARSLDLPQQAATAGPSATPPTGTPGAGPSDRASPSGGSAPTTPQGTATQTDATQSDAVQQAVRDRAKALADIARKVAARSQLLESYTDITMVSFNVLGNSHTTRKGKNRGMASGPVRAGWVGQLFNQHGVDVAAIQEFQRPQASTFNARYGGTYGVWPGTASTARDGENSVVWRKSRFDLVKTEFRSYPYFGGNRRNYPLVLLRDKASGVEFWVTSYHNPAFPQNVGWKRRAVEMEIADANALLSEPGHAPLLVAGDMNDRSGFFCPYASRTPMRSASPATVAGGGCSVPRPNFIDWIMGSSGVQFSGYTWDRGPLVRRASDHPMIITQARIWKADKIPDGAPAP